jgi:hypothetical protein
MRQRPPVLGHRRRIASIEPALTARAPRKIIDLERSAVGFANSPIGHVRL